GAGRLHRRGQILGQADEWSRGLPLRHVSKNGPGLDLGPRQLRLQVVNHRVGETICFQTERFQLLQSLERLNGCIGSFCEAQGERFEPAEVLQALNAGSGDLVAIERQRFETSQLGELLEAGVSETTADQIE